MFSELVLGIAFGLVLRGDGSVGIGQCGVLISSGIGTSICICEISIG